MPRLSAIVAMSENRVIGNQNQLPWHLPADLKHFKMITMGHPILMGRKTYESIGKPLPNRHNIIMTRDTRFVAPGCTVVNSFEKALAAAEADHAKEIFVIGGAEIFRQGLSRLQRIYLTLIHAEIAGDTFFPELGQQEWKEIERADHSADQQNAFAYSFLTLERIKHS